MERVKCLKANASVSLFISKKLAKNIKDWNALNERMIMAELKVKGYQILLVGVYASSNVEPAAVKDQHNEQLSHLLESNTKEIILLVSLMVMWVVG